MPSQTITSQLGNSQQQIGIEIYQGVLGHTDFEYDSQPVSNLFTDKYKSNILVHEPRNSSQGTLS